MTSTTASATTVATKINCAKFYFEYKGHPLEDLATFLDITQAERPDKPIIYFAGDSSLDNKYWISKDDRDASIDVPEIYHETLDKPDPRPDVAFWMNHLLGDRATCINTAVEESMIRERDSNLLPHDAFIRDNIRAQDALVISIGGNDIAFSPTPCTAWHMLQLAWFTSRASLEDGTARPLKYFRNMFGTKVQAYVEKMTAVTKPAKVIVCMIYYPLETDQSTTKGWADKQLTLLGYDRWPGQLQAGIRAMYRQATSEIRVEGTEVVPCALHKVMDGRDGGDYIERVEPSVAGGRKMAGKFVEILGDVVGQEVKQG